MPRKTAIRWDPEQLAAYQVRKAPRAAVLAAPAGATAKARMQALGRLKQGEMNKTEAEYDAVLAADPTVVWRKFEGIKLRLADNTFYTPDFFLMRVDGVLECHECKGFWTDDARVKIKVAASIFPFAFVAVKKQPQKAGGGFSREDF